MLTILVGYSGLLKFIFSSIFLGFLLFVFFVLLGSYFTKKSNKRLVSAAGLFKFDKQRGSVYECGFEAFNDSRGAFEVHFFAIAMLFLLFDVEFVFLLP
jgi:NADH:ubiquinone oxidoreductase subunit 3 (subunit A)